MSINDVMRGFKLQGFSSGPHSLTRGHYPTLGIGERIADYNPPLLFEAPATHTQLTREKLDGTASLYGSPLLHSAQQMYAVRYAQENMGFGGGPVTFVCHWSWFEPGRITVAGDGSFTQEQTEARA